MLLVSKPYKIAEMSRQQHSCIVDPKWIDADAVAMETRHQYNTKDVYEPFENRHNIHQPLLPSFKTWEENCS